MQAELTPANVRAKGVAGMVGSILKHRALSSSKGRSSALAATPCSPSRASTAVEEEGEEDAGGGEGEGPTAGELYRGAIEVESRKAGVWEAAGGI